MRKVQVLPQEAKTVQIGGIQINRPGFMNAAAKKEEAKEPGKGAMNLPMIPLRKPTGQTKLEGLGGSANAGSSGLNKFGLKLGGPAGGAKPGGMAAL